MSVKTNYVDVHAVCPYYQEIKDNMIKCRGDDNTSYSFRGHKRQIKRHFNVFCCTSWKVCPLADGLNRYFERGD